MVASASRGDRPSDRSLWNPRESDIPTKSVNRMYGTCTSPVKMSYNKSTDHERHFRCRNCPGCLRARQFLWQMRGEAEWWDHPRTWFFTGTFRDQTTDYEVVRDEVTRFLKRVRKDSPSGLRYLVLPEPHKSGCLHIHGLLHCEESLTYRKIANAWQAGFHKVKLAKDPRTVGYVVKYTTKGLHDGTEVIRPRIRASRSPTYGGYVMVRDELEVKRLLAERGEEEVAAVWRKNIKMVSRKPQKARGETFLRLLMSEKM